VPRINHRVWIQALSVLTGLVLLVIGVRFLLVPSQAARFFGTAPPAPGTSRALYYVIGLRDIWLALIVIGLAWVRDWRGLALWLGLGAAVCFGDAAIVTHATGKVQAIAFHAICGVFCGALSLASWRQHRRNS